MRCPDCGATNPEHATFCGLCHVRFQPARSPDPPRSVDPAPAADGAATDAVPVGDASAGETGPVARGRFVAEDGRIGWTCAVCGDRNDVETFTCTVCGSRMDAEAEGVDDRRDWDGAKRLESLVPGAGHMRVGLQAEGLPRLIITAFCLLGALALSTGGVSGLITAVPLIAGIATMMLLGPGDLDAARRGRPPRLGGRQLGALVAAVLAGIILLGAVQAVLRG